MNGTPHVETLRATSPRSTAGRVLRHTARDAVRSRWAIANGLFLLLVTDGLFRFAGGGEQVVLSLVNVVLVVVPLVALLFGVTYLYGARDLIELLLAQPVRRTDLFAGLYAGLLLPLGAGVVLGLGLPFLWHGAAGTHAAALVRLLGAGLLLTGAFLAIAFLVAVRYEDRVRGLGTALLAWLLLAVVYDGATLLVAHVFSAYPLERPMLALAMLNPISLARVLLVLALDEAALLGYTGAAFERFFGSAAGTTISLLALVAWTAGPLLVVRRVVQRKDF